MRVNMSGQVALVAGGDTDLGRALVRAMAASGAAVETVPAADLRQNAGTWSDLFQTRQRRHGPVLHIFVDALSWADGEWRDRDAHTLVDRADALMRTAGQAMIGAKSGRILSVISALGLLPARERPVLSATHAAIVSLIRTRAMEFASKGVIVNGLALGAIGAANAHLTSHVPLDRAGTLEEAVAAAMFLLDPENTYTTGHILVADGGWHAGYGRDF